MAEFQKNNESAEFKGVVQMSHNEKGKTDILSMFDLVKLGFRVQMDTAIKNKTLSKKEPKLECLNPAKMGCIIMIVKMKKCFILSNKKLKKE